MDSKFYYLIAGLLVGLFIGGFFSSSSDGLYVSYSASGQTTLIQNGVLSYAVLSPLAVSKCASLAQQTSCYVDSDYVLKKVNLTEDEVELVIEVIRDSEFFELNDSYGVSSESEKVSVHELNVMLGGKIKQVTYFYSPSSENKPEAFQKVVDAIYALKSKSV